MANVSFCLSIILCFLRRFNTYKVIGGFLYAGNSHLVSSVPFLHHDIIISSPELYVNTFSKRCKVVFHFLDPLSKLRHAPMQHPERLRAVAKNRGEAVESAFCVCVGSALRADNATGKRFSTPRLPPPDTATVRRRRAIA